MNQKGEVQAIGGVNEKIEGFFEICQAKGLTGNQGVLIPESNVRHLMLKEDVVEGIEVLTGVKAGERKEDGAFEEGTINDLVNQRLNELAEAARTFARVSGDDRR